jgi:hypothetical protein
MLAAGGYGVESDHGTNALTGGLESCVVTGGSG